MTTGLPLLQAHGLFCLLIYTLPKLIQRQVALQNGEMSSIVVGVDDELLQQHAWATKIHTSTRRALIREMTERRHSRTRQFNGGTKAMRITSRF